MKKLFIVMVLFILFTVPFAHADNFKYIPASNINILNTIIDLERDPKLEIDIFGYVETLTKNNDMDLIEEVLKIREQYLRADIDDIRITIGLGNKGGMIEEKFKFEKDGVYIKLCYN